MHTIEITRTQGGNALVRMGGRAWLIGEHWGEGTNPGPLVGDLWFYLGALDGNLPEKWDRNETAAALYDFGETERHGVFA